MDDSLAFPTRVLAPSPRPAAFTVPIRVGSSNIWAGEQACSKKASVEIPPAWLIPDDSQPENHGTGGFRQEIRQTLLILSGCVVAGPALGLAVYYLWPYLGPIPVGILCLLLVCHDCLGALPFFLLFLVLAATFLAIAYALLGPCLFALIAVVWLFDGKEGRR